MTGASGGARGELVTALAIPASAAFTEHAAALRAFRIRSPGDADASGHRGWSDLVSRPPLGRGRVRLRDVREAA